MVERTTGRITESTSKNSKNGKAYTLLEIDNEFRIYDWQQVSKDFATGDAVKLTHSGGQFPRLLKMEPADKEAVQKELEMDEKDNSSNVPVKFNGNPANSPSYLACKLAVELVKDEQIAVDKKLIRFKKALETVKECL